MKLISNWRFISNGVMSSKKEPCYGDVIELDITHSKVLLYRIASILLGENIEAHFY